jgi:DNA-binding CsgD family transcriptional regulator
VLFGATTFTWIEARLEELEHGPERAWALLAEGDETARPERLMVEEPAAGAWQVSLALAVGDRRRATRLVAISDQVAALNDTVPSIRAGALHAHGLLERDAASIELAASLQPRPGARAAAHEDAGVVRLEDGEVGPGCEQLQLAEAAYRDASNQRAVVRVRSRLHAARAGKASRPVSGWCSLTETEERVAVVVAEGLTNAQVGTRLFLSRHTIDFHLRQIFRKLEIRSRVELTRLVLERQWPSVGPAAP